MSNNIFPIDNTEIYLEIILESLHESLQSPYSNLFAFYQTPHSTFVSKEKFYLSEFELG